MVARIDRFGHQGGVPRQALIPAFRGKTGRLVAQQHHDFVFYVDAGVVVVPEFIGAGSVAGENQASARFTRGRKAERDEIVVELQLVFGPAHIGCHFVFSGQLRAGHHTEWLKKSLGAGWLKPGAFILLLEEIGGFGDAFGVVAAALHVRCAERLDVVEITRGIRRRNSRSNCWCGRRPLRSKGARQCAREEQCEAAVNRTEKESQRTVWHRTP